MVETSFCQEKKSSLKSLTSHGGGESKDMDARVPSPHPSLDIVSEEASGESVSRKKNSGAGLGLKPEDMDLRTSSSTSSSQSVSHGFSGVACRKLTKKKKKHSENARPSTPQREMVSSTSDVAAGNCTSRSASLDQRIATSGARTELPSTKKSIKARLGLTRKELNNGGPPPGPSFRSASRDLPKRTSKKLVKKRKPGADDTRPSTPFRDIISPSPSIDRKSVV